MLLNLCHLLNCVTNSKSILPKFRILKYYYILCIWVHSDHFMWQQIHLWDQFLLLTLIQWIASCLLRTYRCRNKVCITRVPVACGQVSLVSSAESIVPLIKWWRMECRQSRINYDSFLLVRVSCYQLTEYYQIIIN